MKRLFGEDGGRWVDGLGGTRGGRQPPGTAYFSLWDAMVAITVPLAGELKSAPYLPGKLTERRSHPLLPLPAPSQAKRGLWRKAGPAITDERILSEVRVGSGVCNAGGGWDDL